MRLNLGVKAAVLGFLLGAAFASDAYAQAAQVVAPTRITQAINENNVRVLRGNTHPLAQVRFDQGAAADSMPMDRMLLVLKRSPAQEAALDALLDQQQDSNSANYHHWLTPQQFGQQFGPSDQDIQTIANWLQSRGFSVTGISNGRTVIEFSGTAGQVRQSFHAEIHQYSVNGQSYWANSTDPQIPAALAPVVAGVNTLYNFPREAMHEVAGVFDRSRTTGAMTPATGADLTFPNPCSPTARPFCNFAVGPADFAKIYNVPNAALVPAPTTQYNGDNQTMVIVGESDINTADVASFRTLFGLPPAKLNIIVAGTDPGTVRGLETEADLDVEWSGAVAPNATIDYVIAQSTETSLGVDLAAQYAVDNNLGGVLSESYGICEFFMGTADNVFYNQLWQQAAAQGITVTVSTGDAGSAVCDQNAGTTAAARYGLSVSGFASTPYNVAVGGTDFNDVNNFSQFWNTAPSDTPTRPSALGYIPEMTWNDTCTNQEIFSFFGVTTAEQSCNNTTEKNDGLVSIGGGSGGSSNCTVSDAQNESSCSGGYPKPPWQAGVGVPSDGRRDLPDVSLFASNGFNSSFYIICEKDFSYIIGSASCDPNSQITSFVGVGGTSASAPAFAGIMALVDQATGERQGNANYLLYKLAAQSGAACTSAANPDANCIFYDVPSGSTIAMPCVWATPNCKTTVATDTTGVLTGFATTAGYDLATGLGSVNAANLISAWCNDFANLTPTTTTLTLNSGNSVNITHGQSVPVTIAVTGSGGTPTGTVSLIANTGAGAEQAVGGAPLVNGSATFSTNSLPGGTSYTVVAQYPGDSAFAPSTSTPASVTVAQESSAAKLAVMALSPTTRQIASISSVRYGSIYFLRADVTNSFGSDCLNWSTGLQAYACPTGSVTVASDGSALPGSISSTLALNSQGYVESQPVQLPGGTHSLTASYAGDNSYSASNSTATIFTVTPAPTTTSLSGVQPLETIVIGSNLWVFSQTVSNSLGQAPTGTFTVLDGTQALATSGPITGYTSPGSGLVGLSGNINTTLAAPSGPHSLSVRYNGDGNYTASTSSAITVDAVYPTAMTVTLSPTSIVYGTNAQVTVTATLDTGNPASDSALKPTGTISFPQSVSPISSTIGPDSKGNWMIQSIVSISPQQSEGIGATYAGDTNYASANGGAFVTVIIPDFSITAPSQALPITAGQTGTATVTITPLTNYTTTVTLACPSLYNTSSSVPGVTCTFAPSSVTLSNGAPATATLSVATLAPSSAVTAMSLPRAPRRVFPLPFGRSEWLSLGITATFAAFLLLTLRQRARFPRVSRVLFLVGIFCFVIGCGGGGGNNVVGSGGGGGLTRAGTITTLSATTTKLASGSTATLTATVSPMTASGPLSFQDATSYWTYYVNSLASGSTQVQITGGQYELSAGTHAIAARYQGDGSTLPSQSAPLNIVVTGNATLTVTGQTSTDSHTVNIPITIQ